MKIDWLDVCKYAVVLVISILSLGGWFVAGKWMERASFNTLLVQQLLISNDALVRCKTQRIREEVKTDEN